MIAQDCDGSASGGRIVGGSDGAAEKGLGTEKTEIVAGDQTRGDKDGGRVGILSDLVRRWTQANLRRKAAVGGDALERTRIGLKLAGKVPGEQAVIAKVHAAYDPSTIGLVEGDQLLRVTHRKVAQEYLVNQGKDGGVAANPESDGEDGHAGKAGTLGEGAQANANILQQALERGLPTRRPDLMLDCVAASDFCESGAPGSLFRHAAALLIGSGGFHIAFQFLVKLCFHPLRLQQGFKTIDKIG